MISILSTERSKIRMIIVINHFIAYFVIIRVVNPFNILFHLAFNPCVLAYSSKHYSQTNGKFCSRSLAVTNYSCNWSWIIKIHFDRKSEEGRKFNDFWVDVVISFISFVAAFQCLSKFFFFLYISIFFSNYYHLYTNLI